MKNSNKIFTLIFLFLFISFVSHWINSTSEKTTSDTIKIGAVASLTGAAGEQGTNWLQGVTLAVDDANLKGIDVRLYVEDDQTQPAKVVSSLNKLIQIEKINAVIGGTWDYLAEAAFPVAIKNKVPFITPTNPIEIITDQVKESGFVYSNALTLSALREAARGFIVNEQITSIGIVFPDLPYGTRQADIIKELSTDLKIPIFFEYAFPPSSLMSDTVKLAAQKILQTNPSLTFMVIDYNGLDLFTKECQKLRIQPKVLTTQHLDQAFLFSNEPSRYKNMYAVYPTDTVDVEFKQNFIKRFNHPPKVYAQEGYAAAQVLIELFQRRKTITGDPLSIQTILGEYNLPNEIRLLGLGGARITTTKDGTFSDY